MISFLVKFTIILDKDAHLPNLKSTCAGCGIHACKNIHHTGVTPNTGADTHARKLGIQQQQQSTDNKGIEAQQNIVIRLIVLKSALAMN